MKNYQFYHIYPLGMLNQLEENSKPKYQLNNIEAFIPHLKSMNINGLYIGPIFESVYHGYDTKDYKLIDQRLGNHDMFKQLVEKMHEADIDVIVDCVFNHVSREFWAFQDLKWHKENSKYKNWFNIDFSRNNHRNDGFSYGTWDGHDELVKLNLENPEVKQYLIEVAKFWVDEFNIDGLRLDACDVMNNTFVKELKSVLSEYVKKDFYVVGEMVHGDYGRKLKETGIDSLTNYEAYKGLYSSLNDTNYFEIAYSFKRLFGNGEDKGVVGDSLLYNFVDNHDVNRVASVLKKEEHLYPLYLMLYTMKGYTSLYYKSEFGEKGMRDQYSDKQLRQAFIVEEIQVQNALYKHIKKLSEIRKELSVLVDGKYREVFVDHSIIAYLRYNNEKTVLVLINSSSEKIELNGQRMSKIRQDVLSKIGYSNTRQKDLLNNEYIDYNRTITLDPNWGRIIA